MTRTGAVATLLIAGLLAGTLGGCASKVSKANYDKLETGMTEKQVTDILGQPTEKTEAAAGIGDVKLSGATWTWKDGDKTIAVVFANEKVASFTQTNLEKTE